MTTRRFPRTSGEAFKDAGYSCALTIYGRQRSMLGLNLKMAALLVLLLIALYSAGA
jgi:hypothetical protein